MQREGSVVWAVQDTCQCPGGKDAVFLVAGHQPLHGSGTHNAVTCSAAPSITLIKADLHMPSLFPTHSCLFVVVVVVQKCPKRKAETFNDDGKHNTQTSFREDGYARTHREKQTKQTAQRSLEAPWQGRASARRTSCMTTQWAAFHQDKRQLRDRSRCSLHSGGKSTRQRCNHLPRQGSSSRREP